MRAWPPRLPDQPIFYPVLNRPYAQEISSKWNTKSERFVGYVTQFEVDSGFCARYERQVVGGRQHEELWVPAEELDEFNENIVGRIEVVDAFFGSAFRGRVPEDGPLRGLDADEQLEALRAGRVAIEAAVSSDPTTVFVHCPRWVQFELDEGFREALKQAWAQHGPSNIRLPTPAE